MGFGSWGAENPTSKMRVLDHFAGFRHGTALLLAVVVVLGLSNMGVADAAEAIYFFGDSYFDTGNIGPSTPSMVPYGMDWPGHPSGRWSDGRSQTDYFAELFGLPTPTPYLHLKNDSLPLRGINFARGGGGVTYAFGVTALDSQVDEMEALVHSGSLTEEHLKKSVAVMNVGVNDYDARNYQAPFQKSDFGGHELETFVHTVVNGIAVNVMRLYSLGICNIVVMNLPYLPCIPLAIRNEVALKFRACSTNTTFVTETALHDSLLQQRLRMLNQQLKGLHVVIADQTKALHQLFYNGSAYGFESPLTPCCRGKNSDRYSLVCGYESEGKPIYTVCQNPTKVVLFDAIHPSQAASKALVKFYAFVPGYTLEGPMLSTWIRKYKV